MVSSKTLKKFISDYPSIPTICLPKAIMNSCKTLSDCVFSGKSSHQSRIPIEVLDIALKKLTSAKLMSGTYADFEELYDKVDDLLRPIKGIGDTAIYEFSVRIGNNLLTPKVLPDKYVYIHRGSKDGAKKLLGVSRLSFRVDKSKFPKDLQKLTSVEIEDFLCTFKDKL